MKKVLVMILVLFAFGCSDDATEPSENMIVGKWMRFYDEVDDDEDVLMVIEFTEDRKFTASNVLDENENGKINGVYSVANNIITMNDEDCEGIEGKYELEFRDNGVEFILIKDECDRSDYMTGFFDKYKATLYNK